MDTTDKSNEGQEKTKEMTIEKYNNYAKGMDANQEVQTWVSTNLYNHLKKSEENQNEIEHIIDYLVSDKAPKRLKKMSYAQAKSNTDKWNKALIKKGAKINESEKDIEIVLELDNGFKWVKLVGENAFKREGALMRHCVSSYYGKDVDIYSLRDKKNEPHCTVEKDQQIKGKGNGNIHPKYISYVVSFLEWTGMEVSDNEMLNLGYINISDFKEDLSEECIKQSYKEVYLPKDFKFKDKEGSDFWSLDIMDKVPLLDLNLDIAIPLELIGKGCSYLLNKIFKAVKKDSGDYTQNASSGYNTKNASSGYNTQNASSGDYTQNASSGDYTQNASSGDYTKNASSGDYTQNASSGYNTQNASSGYNTQNASSGDYTQNASSGDYTQNASSGYNTKNASSGYNTQNASSGYNTQNASSGDYTQNASS
ncbi:PcfJ domain-containing protein, partial [Flagellimonas sp. CMM7]